MYHIDIQQYIRTLHMHTSTTTSTCTQYYNDSSKRMMLDGYLGDVQFLNTRNSVYEPALCVPMYVAMRNYYSYVLLYYLLDFNIGILTPASPLTPITSMMTSTTTPGMNLISNSVYYVQFSLSVCSYLNWFCFLFVIFTHCLQPL